MMRCCGLLFICCVVVVVVVSCQHSNNWAVLVCASRDWRNYRHVANALSLYRTVKRLGIPDSHIILMLADDIACNARNTFPAAVYNEKEHTVDLYGSNVETDYRGYEVTVENFIRVLTGRHDAQVPRSKRMTSDSGSNILIYITGHGGDEFLRFQSQEDLSSKDIADAIAQMHEKQRYNEILFVVDTCQAATLYSKIRSPNVFSIGSSIKGESSYSYLTDPVVGVSLMDRFTVATLSFFEGVDIHSKATLSNLLGHYTPRQMLSTIDYSSIEFQRSPDSMPLTDFFGHVAMARTIKQTVRLRKSPFAANRTKPFYPAKAPEHQPNEVPAGNQQLSNATVHNQFVMILVVSLMLAVYLVDKLRE